MCQGLIAQSFKRLKIQSIYGQGKCDQNTVCTGEHMHDQYTII